MNLGELHQYTLAFTQCACPLAEDRYNRVMCMKLVMVE